MNVSRFLSRTRNYFFTPCGRRRLVQFAIIPIVLAGVLTVAPGCTAEAKKARRLEKANRFFAEGNYEKAEIEYRNVMMLDPNNPDAISHLALMFFDQGRTGVTGAYLKKASELQPNNLDIRLKLGMQASAYGRRTEARDQAMFVLERRPNDEEAPLLLVETITQPKEIETIRGILKKLPSANGAPVLISLGLLELRENKLKEAEGFFQQAKKVAPKSGAVAYAWALLYSAQKNQEEATKAFAEAAALSPIRSPRRIRYAQFCMQMAKPEEARKALKEVTEKAPDCINAWFFLANMAATEKKYDEALSSVGKVLALDQFHHDALLLRSSVKFSKGDREVAITELERQAKVFPKSAEMQFQLGRFYLNTGSAEKAAAVITQGLTIAPDAAGMTLILAEINLRLGKTELVVNPLKQLIQKNPTIPDARLLLAQTYVMQSNPEGALAIYRQMDKDFSPNPRPSFLSGMIYLQQKKLQEARAAFTKALEIEPGFSPALEQIVNFDLAGKKYAEAQKLVEAQVQKTPKAAELHLLLAKIHLAASDQKKGEEALQKVVELQPDSPVGNYLLARLYVGGNDKEKALTNLNQAITKNPKNLEALMLRAAIHEQQNDFKAAKADYEAIVAVNPKAAVALNNLAFLHYERFGDVEKAYELAQKAWDLRSRDPIIAANIEDTLGWIHFKKRQYPRALTLIGESAEKLPGSPEVQFHLGMANYMMGLEKPAQAALERALAINATFPGAADAKQALAILAIDPKTDGKKSQAMLEKAVTDRPDDPVALVRLGLIYEQAGAMDKAATSFEAALKANPTIPASSLNLIRLHVKRKEPARALEIAKAARKAAPDDVEVARALGRLAFATGDYTWAFGLAQEVSRKVSDDPEVFFEFAQAAYSKGQASAAETALREALKLNPAFPQATVAKAMLEMMELAADPARAAGAMSKIEQRLQVDADDVPALMALGSAQERKPDVAAAKKSYEKAVARYPDFSPALRNLTLLAAKGEGSDAKAEERGVKAREAFPNDAPLAKALGIVASRNGNISRAKSLLLSSSRELPTDAEVFFYLGKAQIGSNERVSGVKSLQKAIELGLKGEQATEAKKLMAPQSK